jgi:hypothetical protein
LHAADLQDANAVPCEQRQATCGDRPIKHVLSAVTSMRSLRPKPQQFSARSLRV